MLNTYHFAYTGMDEEGITQDASLLMDEDSEEITSYSLASKLTAFLRACGWQKVLVTIQ